VIAAEVGKITKDALKTQLDPTRAPVSNNEAAMLMSQELFTAQDDMSYGSDDDDAVFGANNPIVTRDGKMTVAQRNRQTRARERRAEEDANRLSKRQRQDLSNLKELKQGLAAVAETQEGKRARLATARAEKKAQTPSRLGKHLYQPEHADVLLTEEVTGSLRTLAGSHTLLRDRLKSLQRRELVEPRKRQQKVKSKNFLKYEPGAKGEKETELHEAALKVTRETSKNKSTPL
jgi:nucleolar protein 53